MSVSVWGRFTCAVYRIRNFACSSLIRNSADVRVDVPVLFLATVLTQMKTNTFKQCFQVYFTKFHSVGKERGGEEIEAT